MPDFEWAMFHVSQGRRVRRASWPVRGESRWRVWAECDLGMNYPVCGWGGQVGMEDSERIEGVGIDGTNYKSTLEDKAATDWEML
jgi:hypothetical protein